MKKFFIAFAAFATALMMTVSCDEITDEQKDGLTKVLLAGEYGVISTFRLYCRKGYVNGESR